MKRELVIIVLMFGLALGLLRLCAPEREAAEAERQEAETALPWLKGESYRLPPKPSS